LSLSENLELTAAWQDIRLALRQAVSGSAYDVWLAPLELISLVEGTLFLRAPGGIQPWISKRFGRVLERSAGAVLGPGVRVVVDSDSGAPWPRRASAFEGSVDPAISDLNPRYTFDQFIISDGNRLAHAASLAVAELPGQAYNPLFLHAPPGLGKTHLLHAIGNYVMAFGGGATVRYTTVEAFTNHFIHALSSRSVESFKRAYRDADVLLIDDVQFLASKAKTEEEFFHTFNSLYETGRQLVLTCDRLPQQLEAIEERLRERFEAGLVADIKPPELPARVAILRKRAALDRVHVADPDVLELIAERVTDNVRALEGALIRVVAYHSLTGRQLDRQMAKTVLDGLYPQSKRERVSLADIQAAVASYYQLSVPELISTSKAARVAWPRQLAIHLARQLTEDSLHDIGAAFGGRNHATVLYACKRVSERLGTDRQSTMELDELTETLRAKQGDRPD
jgi:chromosomal replication initiator protein